MIFQLRQLRAHSSCRWIGWRKRKLILDSFRRTKSHNITTTTAEADCASSSATPHCYSALWPIMATSSPRCNTILYPVITPLSSGHVTPPLFCCFCRYTLYWSRFLWARTRLSRHSLSSIIIIIIIPKNARSRVAPTTLVAQAKKTLQDDRMVSWRGALASPGLCCYSTAIAFAEACSKTASGF